MDTLETLATEINHVVDEIKTTLKKCAVPDNAMIVRDEKWGAREILLVFRMDEFSVRILSESMPEIDALHKRFVDLRTRERKIMDDVKIKMATTPGVAEKRFYL